MDTFLEYMVKRKKNSIDFILITGIIMVAINIIILLFFLASTPLGVLMFPLQALTVYFCCRLITSRNIEFEYCITNGDLDVDKIVNKQKRKTIASIETKNIIAMAPLGSEKLQPFGNKKITDATSGDAGKKVYCVIYGNDKALLFEPKEAMALEMQKKNPRNIFVD